MNILVTGSKGFICGYLIEELLNKGHTVVGIDNFSKYGNVAKSYDNHHNYKFFEADAKDTAFLKTLIETHKIDHVVAAAAMIGGISYFHEFAYDLLAENERIIASTFDAAIKGFKQGIVKKITVLSSSMVFENASIFPTYEGHQSECPPPSSTYGFQKLAVEYFAKGAYEQYKLPYTIVRPFNCIGTGEGRALCDVDIMSGNVKLALSHVVPDLVQKVLKGQDPLRIFGDGNQVRHYTYGGDLGRGICECIFNPKATNEDFNLSTNKSTSVLELAELIWKKCGKTEPFRYISDPPFQYDVQKRVPHTHKAQCILGYTADTTIDQALDEIVPWIKVQINNNRI